jgi:hypothetical protein
MRSLLTFTWLRWNCGKLVRGHDGISLISKVKPLKFCLMSKVFDRISLISKVFRENVTLDKTLEVSQNV